MLAAVLGNGESRKDLNLHQLKNTHVLIGCNAIHRDFVVDHLICCDRRMVSEAVNNPSTENTKIYTRPDWYDYFKTLRKDLVLLPNLPYKGNERPDEPMQWGSGPYAVLLGAMNFKEIDLYGFDLYGADNNRVNNIYKGTNNYSKPESHSVDPRYWIYQISKVFELYPDRIFRIHIYKNWQIPDNWKKINVSVIDL